MEQLSLRERNKQKVRERLLTAAFELFKRNGYHQTTMDEIAERAEISRGTLFNYFPTKDSLLIPFTQDLFKTQITPIVTSYLHEQHTTIQALRFLFMTIHEHVLTIPYIDQAFKQEFLRPKDIQPDEFEQRNEFLDILASVLRYGQQQAEVRTDMLAEQLAHYIGVLYVSVYFTMIMGLHPQLLDYENEIDNLLTFVSNSLVPITKTTEL